MPRKLEPPASFLQPVPGLSQQAQEQLTHELLADFAHMCRCSQCEKRAGLFYEECCHRILCESCHMGSSCGRTPQWYDPEPKTTVRTEQQSSLWNLVS